MAAPATTPLADRARLRSRIGRWVGTAARALRVEGPAAIEIQHLAGVICERVNRFLGWRAIERIALRQAPLRRASRKPERKPDAAAAARLAASLSEIADDDLRAALARLGAAVKRLMIWWIAIGG